MVIGSRQKRLAESHDEINIKLEDQVIINKVDQARLVGSHYRQSAFLV